ncbi:MAG: HEAT repeat domain-containing protein [Chloroflexota bacterium]
MNKPIYYLEFSELLEQWLQEEERSQRWLAKKIFVAHDTVSKWINKGTRPESAELIIKIANTLNKNEEKCEELLKAAHRYTPLTHVLETTNDTNVLDAIEGIRNRSPATQIEVGQPSSPSAHLPEEELRNFLARIIPQYEAKMLLMLRKPEPPKEPYKSLLSYEMKDAEIFFGRDEEIQILCEKVLKERLTVVHAKSGAGKTSLLNSGLSLRLIQDGWLPIYARTYPNPLENIKRCVFKILSGWPELIRKSNLHQFLEFICEYKHSSSRGFVIILDQFEEIFTLQRNRELRGRFMEDLANSCDNKRLPVRFVIAIRKDYFADLANFDDRIPAIFNNQYMLKPLLHEQAREAITAPLTKLVPPMYYEQDLLDTLLNELTPDNIELPHLQIICTKLYEKAVVSGEVCIEKGFYDQLSGASGILGNYLNGTLGELPGRGQTIAKQILKELVSLDLTKCPVDYETIMAQVDATKQELDDVLRRLDSRHLLRRDEQQSVITYELAHEYLITEIQEWLSHEDIELRKAQSLLDGEVLSWQLHSHDYVIPSKSFGVIYTYRERLRNISNEAFECILRTSIRTEPFIEKWYEFFTNHNKVLFTDVMLEELATISDDTQRRMILRNLGRVWDILEITSLGDEKVSTRKRAAKILGELQNKLGVEPLISALKDVNDSVRVNAAEALGLLKHERAVVPLISALQDDVSDVCIYATLALGKIGSARAVEPLILMLQTDNWKLRHSVAMVLGQLGDSALKPLIAAIESNDWKRREGAVEALGYLGNVQAVDTLIDSIYDENEYVRRVVPESLGRLGDIRAVEPILALLHEPTPLIRYQAINALGKLGDIRAVKPLCTILQDENERIHQPVPDIMGLLGNEQATKPDIVFPRDSYIDVRQAAAEALGLLGDEGIESLILTLQVGGKGARQRVAKVLGDIGVLCAVEPLILLLNGQDGGLNPSSNIISVFNISARISATGTLNKKDEEQAIQSLLDILNGGYRHKITIKCVIDALKNLGVIGENNNSRTLEPLIMALQQDNADIRIGAANALIELGDPRALEPLIVYIGSAEPKERRTILRTLRRYGDDVTIELLITTLQHKSKHVRDGACTALIEVGCKAVRPLIFALKNNNSVLRQEAVMVLGRLRHKRAVEPLILALKDDESDVCKSAAKALGLLRDKRAIWPLIELILDPNCDVEVAASAEVSIAKFEQAAVAPLISVTKDVEMDINMRCKATKILGKLNNEEALEPLIAMLMHKQSEFRKAAAIALGDLNNRQSIEPLVAALQDSHVAVRALAALAIGTIGDEREVEPLINALRCENEKANTAIGSALANLGEAGIKSLVIDLINKDNTISQRAAEALEKLHDSQINQICNVLQNEDSESREAAVLILNRVKNNWSSYRRNKFEILLTAVESHTVMS